MTEITDALRDAKRLRLLACALELLQHERVDSAVIAIPGTEPPRFVAIGSAATIAKLLEIDELQRKMLERAIVGLRDGWASRQDANEALQILGSGFAPAPAGYLTAEQIAAGGAVKCDHGQAIGRNVAIDVFDAMKREGGAA